MVNMHLMSTQMTSVNQSKSELDESIQRIRELSDKYLSNVPVSKFPTEDESKGFLREFYDRSQQDMINLSHIENLPIIWEKMDNMLMNNSATENDYDKFRGLLCKMISDITTSTDTTGTTLVQTQIPLDTISELTKLSEVAHKPLENEPIRKTTQKKLDAPNKKIENLEEWRYPSVNRENELTVNEIDTITDSIIIPIYSRSLLQQLIQFLKKILRPVSFQSKVQKTIKMIREGCAREFLRYTTSLHGKKTTAIECTIFTQKIVENMMLTAEDIPYHDQIVLITALALLAEILEEEIKARAQAINHARFVLLDQAPADRTTPNTAEISNAHPMENIVLFTNKGNVATITGTNNNKVYSTESFRQSKLEWMQYLSPECFMIPKDYDRDAEYNTLEVGRDQSEKENHFNRQHTVMMSGGKDLKTILLPIPFAKLHNFFIGYSQSNEKLYKHTGVMLGDIKPQNIVARVNPKTGEIEIKGIDITFDNEGVHSVTAPINVLYKARTNDNDDEEEIPATMQNQIVNHQIIMTLLFLYCSSKSVNTYGKATRALKRKYTSNKTLSLTEARTEQQQLLAQFLQENSSALSEIYGANSSTVEQFLLGNNPSDFGQPYHEICPESFFHRNLVLNNTRFNRHE